MQFLVFLPIFIAFYLILIRPQRQRVNAQKATLTTLAVGDEVMTAGGLIGTVAALGEGEISLEIAPGTVVRFATPAIVRRMPPTTGPASRDADPGVLDLDADPLTDTATQDDVRHEEAG